jgi:hypothetical protein
MRLYIVFEEMGNTPKNSWYGEFVNRWNFQDSSKCKNEDDHEHKKLHDIIKKKGLFNRKNLVTL